ALAGTFRPRRATPHDLQSRPGPRSRRLNEGWYSMRLLQRLIALGVVALVPGGTAFADPPPPPKWEGDAIRVGPTIAKDWVRELRFGQFTAVFEKTSLQEIGSDSDRRRELCAPIPDHLRPVSLNSVGSEAQRASSTPSSESLPESKAKLDRGKVTSIRASHITTD